MATANDLNISQAGYVVFDGTATFTGRTFQAGTGVTLTNASGVAGNTTISVSSSGLFPWNDVSGSFSALNNNGYFITGTATGALPPTPSQGDTIKFFVDHASQVLIIDAPGTQLIRLGTLVTSAGGTVTSTARGDSVELVYRASDTCWCAISGYTGTWLVA